MALSQVVPKEYGYVLLAAASTSFLNYWLGGLVGGYRKAAKVPYPNAYASATEAATSQEKHLFNCAQRAHANFLEAQPSVVTTLLISGLRYPVLSAAMGASWVFFRIIYAIGYTRPGIEGGKGRYRGILHMVPHAALTIMATMVGYQMAFGTNEKHADNYVLILGESVIENTKIEFCRYIGVIIFGIHNRLRRSSLSTVLPSGADYSASLENVAAHIIYRSPLPSHDDLPIFVLNGAALPDADSIDYDALLPYVLARLPDEDELIGGKGYELVFFAGGEERNSSPVKKKRPGWSWFLQAYNVLTRAMRKRLQKLYLVHERRWIRVMMEMFSTVVSPKFRKKIIHLSTLSALALHIPIEDLLIPPLAYSYDRLRALTIDVPYATGRRAFGAGIPLPISSTGAFRLPRVLRESTRFLLTDQNIRTEGLFRINTRAVTISVLREAYDRGQKFIVWREVRSLLTFSHWKEGHGDVVVEELQDMEGFPLTAAAGLIKLWYAELREPIFPQSSYPFLERVFGDQETPIQISTVLDLIGETSDWSPMTKISREILRMHLLPLLSIVAENKDWNHMTPYNLAVCFAPLLLCGPDPMEDAKISTVVRRFLECAIGLWNMGLSSACSMDRHTFEDSLRLPESIEDREDPLDHTDPSSPGRTTQSDGIILVDIDDSDDDDDDVEDRPPLPPRHSGARITEDGTKDSEGEKPPLPPRVAAIQVPGRYPDSASALRRKPVPPLAAPPRYSTIINRDSMAGENLPAYTLTSEGRLNEADEHQHYH